MMTEVQTRFASALLDPLAGTPDNLATASGQGPGRRFEVYRNNVRSGLTGALASRFPAAVRITGEAFFRAMALEYVLKHPPASPLLLGHGSDFPDFVETFQPAAGLPYLADVLRVDGMRSHAYHAADHGVLLPAELATIPAEQVGSLKFALHPSLGVLRSRFPALTIWAMNSGEKALAPITDWQGEDVLVIRPHFDLRVLALPPGGAVFLQVLGAGGTLAEAAEAAFADHPDFNLERNLGGALMNGVFAGLNKGA